MNTLDMASTISDAETRARKLLEAKNAKYNPGHDRLAHFKEDVENIEEQVNTLIGYVKKHWLKLRQMSTNVDLYEISEWTESLDDMVNYMHLLECLLVDSGEFKDA